MRYFGQSCNGRRNKPDVIPIKTDVLKRLERREVTGQPVYAVMAHIEVNKRTELGNSSTLEQHVSREVEVCEQPEPYEGRRHCDNAVVCQRQGTQPSQR